MSGPDEGDSLACLEQRAIKAAICNRWKQAVQLNQQIVDLKPDNVGALNRLGKAYWENNQLDKAKRAFESALTIDPQNIIAFKNIERLKSSNGLSSSRKSAAKDRVVFLEEPGRTKVVRLIRLASCQVLGELGCADEVVLQPRNRFLNVTSQRGVYLGRFPEDLSLRLGKLIRGGNRYQAFVKLVDSKNLHLFVREIKRSARYRNTSSFLFLGVLISLKAGFLN